MENDKNTNSSGFEDIDDIDWNRYENCNHPSHNPPTHLYIPFGKRYRHVCPACGFTYYLYGSPILF